MSKEFVQNKYLEGDTVAAKTAPELKLTIRRYIDQVYYCKVQEDPSRKELVYFERELIENTSLIQQNTTNKGQ